MKNRILSITTAIVATVVTTVGAFPIQNNYANSVHSEKEFVAICKKGSIDETVKKIDGEYEEKTEGNCHIYTFEGDEYDAKVLNEKKDVIVSENINVFACQKKQENSYKKNKEKEWNTEIIKSSKKCEGKSKNRIKVAILDSGIDYSPDINVVEKINMVDDGVDCDIFSDITGHGTSIAGIISSEGKSEAIEGINKNVDIYSARILDKNNNAPISRVVETIYWAIDKKVNIINISFGTKESSSVLKEAIDEAVKNNILVIAAAGNTGSEALYPAAYGNVMSVGAIDSNGIISEFSSKDDCIDVMAPGEDVKSVGAFKGSIIVSGTSISAPHVVGVASLLWGKDKNVPADFIRKLIVESANKSKISKSYKGIVDVEYAFDIYEKVKKQYMSGEKYIDENEYKNDTDIETMTNDYVTGTWSYEGHRQAANAAGKFNDLTSGQIQILKLGAIYPDQKFARMTDNPQWHTATVKNYNNYISNYRCATIIAKKIKKGTDINTTNISKPKDMLEADYKRMIKQVSGIKWTKELIGNHSLTDKNKGFFAMGMAIHAITDSFAHQAYMKKNGKWTHLTHTDGDDTCDNYTYDKYKNRFNCAKEAAENALYVYCQNDTPDHWDYVVNYKDFKLKRLKKYTLAQETYDENFGDMNYIEKGNID